MDSYEKKYKEALEKARQLCAYPTTKPFISDLQNLFPELKKSEDEKIRKEIISHLKYLGKYCQESMPNVNEWIAWLEKQGDKKSFDDLTQQEAMDIAVAKCFEQDEQNPTDKVEPKIKVKYAGCEYNVLEVKDIVGVTYYGIEDEPNHIDYVKAENCEIISGYAIKEDGSSYPTKPVVFSEQKSQRMVSAEAKEALYDKPTDEEMKELLRTEYEKGRADAIAEMKSSWSEKDEKVIAIINNALTESNTPPDDYDKVYDWLESLRKRIGE